MDIEIHETGIMEIAGEFEPEVAILEGMPGRAFSPMPFMTIGRKKSNREKGVEQAYAYARAQEKRQQGERG